MAKMTIGESKIRNKKKILKDYFFFQLYEEKILSLIMKKKEQNYVALFHLIAK